MAYIARAVFVRGAARPATDTIDVLVTFGGVLSEVDTWSDE